MVRFYFSKKKRAVIVVLIIVLLLFACLIIYRVVNFMIGEEILIYLSPSYRSLDVNYGHSENISIKVSLNNNWLCSAKCYQSFVDTSSGVVLTDEYLTFKNHKNVLFTKELFQDDFGQGQKIFQYHIQCANIPSRLCPSKGTLFKRTSTLTWNYDFSDEQKDAISKFKADYAIIKKNMQDSEYYHEHSINIMQHILSDPVLDRIDVLSERFNIIRAKFSKVINYWNNDDYATFFQQNDHSQLVQDSSILVYDLHMLFDHASEMVRLHNEAVSLQSDILSRQDDLNTLMIYPVASSDDEFIANISMLADRTNSLTHLMNIGKGEYSLLLAEMKNINLSINDAQESFIMHVKDLSAAYIDMYVAESLACLEDNCSMLSNYSSLLVKSEQVSLNDSAEFISAVCSHYNALNSLLTARKAVAQSRRLLISDTSATDTEQDRAILMLLLEINSSLYNDLDNNLNERLFSSSPASIRIEEYIKFLNISTGEISREDILYANNYSLNNIFMDENLQNLNAICSRRVSSITLDASSIKPIILDNISVPVSEYYLSSKKSSCCYYGVCIECCANCKKKNPLILLHGHSFNVKTSAYTSTESFNQLEKNLTQDMLYMSLGTPENNLYNRGDVGLSPEPILIKATYYLTSYSDNLGQISVETKAGNIDTYAIRLKEIIDYVTYITGSENVDIVAHSMGGLVVRRYLQVFNDKSVERLIMLGTPNGGIDEKIYSYCKIFGELNECNDMYYDSVFMKKLNDPSSLPQMPKTLIIIGAGCDTGGKNGDGVVSVESASLYNISSIIVNGSCLGTSPMHSKLLDIESYPQVYETIVDFLK